MREHKYRAWSPTMGAMLGWEVVQDMRAGTLLQESPANIPMQFTDLIDTQGKEIYAKDIVTAEWYWDDGPHVIEWPRDYYAVVEFGLEDSLTVIGNIYENPDLVKDRV